MQIYNRDLQGCSLGLGRKGLVSIPGDLPVNHISLTVCQSLLPLHAQGLNVNKTGCI